ncbi:MarR family winged helix-turn-helix transcriptional regulator [Alicyclobacillus sp. ALC3]|uniref:MarR family winged helix-turn-helix transcriptional regulator n=1 Tax=Alicyclobacillus sp. ALC3 TaxID=2796143 RepID=UPI0023788A68|nr:MarR family winged helix-turn-helix transcriptional regulator [Alicyclobacillus sp. ALC3]WDL98370.1 winged helix-turn-helix transcriptional regulator [Alicyclobacillus sp. ALC3]
MTNSNDPVATSGAAQSQPTTDELAAQLDDLLPVITSKILHFIRAVPGTDITRVQEFLIRHLEAHGPCTATMIGTMLGITSGPVTSLTKRLIDKGLMKRTIDASDGRVHWFSLTPDGENLAKHLATYRQTEWKRLVEALGPERVTQGLQLIQETIQGLKNLT